MTDSPELLKRLRMRVRYCWVRNYSLNPAYRELTLAAIQDRLRSFPHDREQMTEEQEREYAELYLEKTRRWLLVQLQRKADEAARYIEPERTGKWGDGSPLPRHGDKVRGVFPGIFGSIQVVIGTVKKMRDGRYIVNIDPGQPVAGRKKMALTCNWRKI